MKESNNKIDMIKSKISSINSIPSYDVKNLINIYNKLIVYADLKKGLILELQGELNLSENILQQLKSNFIFINS